MKRFQLLCICDCSRDTARRVPTFIFCIILIFISAISAQEALTLSATLDLAMRQNPQMMDARADLQISRLQLKAQNASLKPKVDFSLTPVSYSDDIQFNDIFNLWNESRTTQSSGLFKIQQPLLWTDGTFGLNEQVAWTKSFSDFRNVETESYNHRFTLSYSQPIFTYNRQKQALKQQKLSYENQQLNFSMQVLALEKNVASQFYSLYRIQMSYDIAKDDFQNQQKSFEIIQNKAEANLTAKSEVYQAKLNLAQSEMSLKSKEIALQNALDDFRQFLGLPLTQPILLDTAITIPSLSVDMELAVKNALQYRMELRQRAISIQNAQFDLIRTKASNEFNGNLSASYGLVGNNEEIQSAFREPNKSGKFSLSLQIPILDWGQRKARTEASSLSLEKVNRSAEQEKLTIEMDVRALCRNLENLQRQIEIARQSVEYAKLTLDLNLERYKNGDLTSLDLNLYQTQLTQKKMDFVSALANYRIELLNLKVQTLWDFEKNQALLTTLVE